MEFLVKDLLITVFPSKATIGSSCGNCSPVTDRCIGCSETVSRGLIDELFTPVVNPASPQSLAALKTQLREVLAAVEAKEKVVHESLQPKTIQEVEFLQGYMTAALEELKAKSRELAQTQSKEKA